MSQGIGEQMMEQYTREQWREAWRLIRGYFNHTIPEPDVWKAFYNQQLPNGPMLPLRMFCNARSSLYSEDRLDSMRRERQKLRERLFWEQEC